MYSVLIADDEPLIRKALREKINWSEHGFNISYEAKNGLEALELLKVYNPDVLLTDMKMPYMDGVKLLDSINSAEIKTKVIVISAYSSFSYTHAAIKNSAFDYLLKPIAPQKLSEVMYRLKTHLDAEHSTVQEMPQYISQMFSEIKFSSDIQESSKQQTRSNMNDIIMYVQTHYFEDITLQELSKKFFMNMSYLSHSFKKYTGESFVEYLTRIRMTKATELLETTNHKISDIAVIIGYKELRYFSKVFKKHMGMIPDQYRKSKKK
ncbi:response regulator [Paenibacillus sp. LHD-117]|uniref:response regulator transcription factor n=1 Tax=Paenibacillus sp. LHD-117 TaxID=3071412 RepID=UPI0027E0401D|nr:response regulator [Paenibacillus sp. LHD-117]MDQ6417926.1 response regulator [Paenibacillus sp. LHD-117]